MVDLSKYKALFLSESQEHLQSMNECFLKMEQGEVDEELIFRAFRNAHSLKGMAASMGYEPIRDLAHSMEDLLDQIRQKQREIETEILEILFQATDRIEQMLKEVEEDQEIRPGWQELENKIRQLLKKKPQIKSLEPQPPPASAPPDKTRKISEGYLIQALVSLSADAPSIRAMVLLKRLEELGKITKSEPDKNQIKQGQIPSTDQGYPLKIYLETKLPPEEIEKTLKSISELEKYEIQGLEELPVEEISVEAESKPSPEAEPSLAPMPQTVRVSTRLLDDFINSLGEMILIRGELEQVVRQHPAPGLRQGLDRLERLIREFHDQVMSARLLPIELVVQRLPRLVRDLAREQGKEVELEIKGKEIELDRALLEKLPDPLVHIIRNALSHGIEPPEERTAQGKPRKGKILIQARQERDMVILEITDDGRGIDPEMVKARAREKGLISEAQARELSEEQALNLIFLPGFSTAEKVGMVSGRGVGMDVVKNVIEGMGGAVYLSSKPGKGTSIALHLPRTVAIVNVLLVRLGEQIFALPISRILRSVEILPYQIRKSQNTDYYLERQELIPMIYFHRLLDLSPPEELSFPVNALIAEVKKKKWALIVDELVGQEEAFIRPLGKPLERISGLAGVTMLGDGRVVFVVDLAGLF